MTAFHLAQINIARFRLPKEHEANAGFMEALDAVNAMADKALGLVWRLVGDGNDAISIDAVPDDPRLAVNMSVWTDIEALAAFVYRQPDHLAIMRRRREWLEKMDFYMALWWVPVGHIPSVAEGLERIDWLRKRGPSADAFTFRDPFAAPDGTPVIPQLDKCA
jgi:hypothetical protein